MRLRIKIRSYMMHKHVRCFSPIKLSSLLSKEKKPKYNIIHANRLEVCFEQFTKNKSS